MAKDGECMYNLLVVDDEEIAIKGIVHGIDWSDMPLGSIYEAYDAEEAMRTMEEHPIHLLLSDIDMPYQSGIDLLEWVNIRYPETEVIFLTGHADFHYAQQAIQLNSFDYLLKPVDHLQLKETLMKAIEKIRRFEERKRFHQMYEAYYQQWMKQLPSLIEQFWKDLLNFRVPLTSNSLDGAFQLYGIPMRYEDCIQVVLISVEQWREELGARDEEVFTYALKNAAEEIMLRDREGHIIRDSNGLLLALQYRPGTDNASWLAEASEEYIAKCNSFFNCSLSCYIGDPVDLPNLMENVRQLMEMERNNVSQLGTVLTQKDYRKASMPMNYQPNFKDWEALLEAGKRNELNERLNQVFVRMKQEAADYRDLEAIYYGLVHTVYTVFQRKKIPMEEVYTSGDWRDVHSITKSLVRIEIWATNFLRTALDHLSDHSKDVSSVINKVIQFIDRRLSDDFNREDVAAHVYLNSAYLSRLFKKETGMSLSDYITDERVKKAKMLLEKSNMKISDVALQVGYVHFSHFSKMFKRSTGLAPHEFRRKFQEADSS
jgi:two-component system response regulator YesN